MSKVPGYEGPAHPLSSPIEALTATCTAHTIIERLESGIARVHSTWPVQFLVDATLSRSLLLLKFGRFRMDGPLPKS
jgi:hypothetical protein